MAALRYENADKVLLDNISAQDICRELVAELRNWDDWKGRTHTDILFQADERDVDPLVVLEESGWRRGDDGDKTVAVDRGVVDSYEKDGVYRPVQDYACIPCPDRVSLYLDSDGKLVRREVESSLPPRSEPARDTFRTVTTGRPGSSIQERSSRSLGR